MRQSLTLPWMRPFLNPSRPPVVNLIDLKYLTFHRANPGCLFLRQVGENTRAHCEEANARTNYDSATRTIGCGVHLGRG
jgi:hypothetical protein